MNFLLPIGKAPRRGREHNQSISQLGTKSFRTPPTPVQTPKPGEKKHKEGLKHALHGIFYHCKWSHIKTKK